jgi:hypothetical protein
MQKSRGMPRPRLPPGAGSTPPVRHRRLDQCDEGYDATAATIFDSKYKYKYKYKYKHASNNQVSASKPTWGFNLKSYGSRVRRDVVNTPISPPLPPAMSVPTTHGHTLRARRAAAPAPAPAPAAAGDGGSDISDVGDSSASDPSGDDGNRAPDAKPPRKRFRPSRAKNPGARRRRPHGVLALHVCVCALCTYFFVVDRGTQLSYLGDVFHESLWCELVELDLAARECYPWRHARTVPSRKRRACVRCGGARQHRLCAPRSQRAQRHHSRRCQRPCSSPYARCSVHRVRARTEMFPCSAHAA